jgi:hypothetical protein
LKEALCGFKFDIQHLDGRTLHIKTAEGQVLKPNSWMVVANEGMPVHTRPFVKGNLYILFKVGALVVSQAHGVLVGALGSLEACRSVAISLPRCVTTARRCLLSPA